MNTDRKPLVLESGRVELRCLMCECPETHVVDARWEIDPNEGNRKRVRMEVRCEMGHGYILSLTNHAGSSYFRWEPLTDIRGVFGEEQTW